MDSGAAGATTTSQWIGDLALMYAINSSLNIKNIPFKYASHRPSYGDILETGIFTSIAMPIGHCKRTQVFDIATSFISDGFPNMKAIEDSGRAPMRNWMKRQGLQPGNKFSFALFTKDEELKIPEKFTIRLGNTKECLAVCTSEKGKFTGTLCLNAYTIGLIYGNDGLIDILSKIRENNPEIYIEQKSSQYLLINNFPLSGLKDLYNYT